MARTVMGNNDGPAPKFKAEPFPHKPMRGPQLPPTKAATAKRMPPTSTGAGDVTQRDAGKGARTIPTGPKNSGHSTPMKPKG